MLAPVGLAWVVHWIETKARNNATVNRTELPHHCCEHFGTAITQRRVDSFISRHSDHLCETRRIPQENPRLGVPRAIIDAAAQSFREHVHSPCTELIFNLDEIGISEREDRARQKVIVSDAMKNEAIYHGLQRNLKHISIVVSISAAGENMTPFFVSSQAHEAVQRRLKINGFRLGTNLTFKHRDKP
jgi:hypothetical protein